jgi:hypothetical protein
MMSPIDTVTTRLRRRASGSVFLTDADIAEIVNDFLHVNDAVQMYDLISEITCIAAFFNAGDGPEVARALMQKVIPVISKRAANLAAIMHGTRNQPSARARSSEPRYDVKGAFQRPAESTKVGIRRHNP